MKNNFLIKRFGYPYIGYSFLAFVLFDIFDFEIFATISFIATVFFIFIFRDTKQIEINISKSGLVSPVSGTITHLDENEDGFCIGIESTVLDKADLRFPCSYDEKYLQHTKGTRLQKESKLFKKLNEKLEVVLNVDNRTIKLLHTVKNSPVGIFLTDDEKQYGFMVNGITNIYVPKDFRYNNLYTGKKLKTGETILGYFTNK